MKLESPGVTGDDFYKAGWYKNKNSVPFEGSMMRAVRTIGTHGFKAHSGTCQL